MSITIHTLPSEITGHLTSVLQSYAFIYVKKRLQSGID